MNKKLTAIIEREGNGYVSLCPEVDVASQGDTIDEAKKNLCEALELFFEMASPEEIKERFHDHKEIRIGTLLSIIRQSGMQRSEFES